MNDIDSNKAPEHAFLLHAATKDSIAGTIVVLCTHEPMARETTVDQLEGRIHHFEAKSERSSVFRKEKHHGHQVSESEF